MLGDRTTWGSKHTERCEATGCPCYQAGIADQMVTAGPSAVEAGAEIAVLRAEVESLRTQLAAAQAEAASAPCNQALCGIYTIEDLRSDLAAVRTDLSEARRALEDIAREDYRGRRPSGAVKAAAALVLLDQSESAGAGGPLPEA